jgi:hypothetical protein
MILKGVLNEQVSGVWTRLILLRIGSSGYCEHGNELSDPMKGGEIIGQLSLPIKTQHHGVSYVLMFSVLKSFWDDNIF